jgi:hypothetical protein
VYDDCPYLCLTKKQHHSRYARIRKSKSVETKKIPSPKVNWYVVEQLKLSVKPLKKEKTYDEIELQ